MDKVGSVGKPKKTFKDLLVEKQITSYMLSKASRAHTSVLYRLENGDAKFSSLRVNTALSIARVLHMSIEEIVHEIE